MAVGSGSAGAHMWAVSTLRQRRSRAWTLIGVPGCLGLFCWLCLQRFTMRGGACRRSAAVTGRGLSREVQEEKALESRGDLVYGILSSDEPSSASEPKCFPYRSGMYITKFLLSSARIGQRCRQSRMRDGLAHRQGGRSAAARGPRDVGHGRTRCPPRISVCHWRSVRPSWRPRGSGGCGATRGPFSAGLRLAAGLVTV